MCLSVSGYVDEGRHFQVHSSDCTKFVEVVPGVGGTVTFIKSCSFGLFWDEISLTCVNSTQADCFNGKLSNEAKVSFHNYLLEVRICETTKSNYLSGEI